MGHLNCEEHAFQFPIFFGKENKTGMQQKNLVLLIPKTEDSQFPFVYADGAEVAEVLNAALVHDKAGGEKEREKDRLGALIEQDIDTVRGIRKQSPLEAG